MENNDVDVRISLALGTLKSELMDLRSQDVKLMKQLLHIDDTIKTLTKKQSPSRRLSQKRCCSSMVFPLSPLTESKPFTRRLSAPAFENNMGSSSSLEESSSSEDMSDYFESDEDLSFRSPKLSRPPSLSFIRNSDSDICDEDLLKTNIRVWKLSQTNLAK